MDQAQDQDPVPQRGINFLENVQPNPPPPPQKCPRCDSSNTKFCYYNNYSLAQPRYLCKSCRRYWTLGGTLRNVPIGGGFFRRNKRPKLSGPSTSNNEIVSRSQPMPITRFSGMGLGLRSGLGGLDMGTNNNTNFLYSGGATLSSMQGINQPPVGGTFDGYMTPLHGMTFPPLRPFPSPQQLGTGFQLPVSLWAQRLRGGAAGSSNSRAGLWDNNGHMGSLFNPNNCSSNNYQGFGPSQ